MTLVDFKLDYQSLQKLFLCLIPVAPKVSGDFIPRDIIAKKGQPFKIAIPYNGNPIPTVAWTLVRFYMCINHMLQLLQEIQ